MLRDRWEEFIMLLVALGLLSFLWTFSLAQAIIVILTVAVLLILLLVLRGISWHEESITPFDSIILLGVFFTIVYLLSFLPLQSSLLSALTTLVFAAFYILMAVLLARHRGWLFGGRHPTAASERVLERTHRPIITPAHRHARPREEAVRADTGGAAPRKRSFLRRIFRRAHGPEFRKGVEPIHEMTRDDITRHAQQEHHLLPYSDEVRHSLMVALPGSTVLHREGCQRLRSTHPGMRIYINAKSPMVKGMHACPKCKPEW